MIKSVEEGVSSYKEKLAEYYGIKFGVNLELAHDVEENVFNKSADDLYAKIVGMEMVLDLTREEREKYRKEVIFLCQILFLVCLFQV